MWVKGHYLSKSSFAYFITMETRGSAGDINKLQPKMEDFFIFPPKSVNICCLLVCCQQVNMQVCVCVFSTKDHHVCIDSIFILNLLFKGSCDVGGSLLLL